MYNSSKCVPSLDYYVTDEELSSVRLFAHYPDSLLKFASACSILFIIIGIPGNIITICALARYKRIRSASAIFIINLSISDLSFCSVILPLIICVFIRKSWIFGKTMCRIFPLLKYSLTAVTVFNLVAITICRYVLIVHPQNYYKFYNKQNLKIMVLAIWIFPLAILLPTLFEIWGRFSLDPLVGCCTLIPDEKNQSPKNFFILFCFGGSCVVMILCYAHIFWFVKQKTKNVTRQYNMNNEEEIANSDSNVETSIVENENNLIKLRQIYPPEELTLEDSPNVNSSKVDEDTTKFRRNLQSAFKQIGKKNWLPTKRDKKLRTMIIIIMLSFSVCHLPIMLIKAVYSEFSSYPILIVTGYLLLHSTTCLNPIIYVVISNEYRQAYKSLVKSIFNRM